MLSLPDFEIVVAKTFPKISLKQDPDQRDVVLAPKNQDLFVVAGPGTGKTTALSLHVLKLIFVDGLEPEEIVATTFTKRAAAELRSRILMRADLLRNAVLPMLGGPAKKTLAVMDFNRIITGTLDSIAEEALRRNRPPKTLPPILIEDFVSDSIMLMEGIFPGKLQSDPDFLALVTKIRGTNYDLSVAKMVHITRALGDRSAHVQADLVRYEKSGIQGAKQAVKAINDYRAFLQNEKVQDYTNLETEFLSRIKAGKVRLLDQARAIIVDEYQDTNLLQQEIYFEITKAAKQRGGALTVVGDDDQSLYRFRGATVELFTSYPSDFQKRFGTPPQTKYLTWNNRSTQPIVDFVNSYATVDGGYQTARVKGKPPIVCSRTTAARYPILGMFRPDVGTLAHDLSDFIYQVIHGGGFNLTSGASPFRIQVDPVKGGPGDVTVLCSTPREFSGSGKARLPFLLRQDLLNRNPPTRVFNPRGQELGRQPDVAVLCGLILEAIDPAGSVQAKILTLSRDVQGTLNRWRANALTFMNSNPPSPRQWSSPLGLAQYVGNWQAKKAFGTARWSKRAHLAQLCYKLIPWIPALQDDIEGLTFLEVIQRAITESSQFSSFGSEIVFDPAQFSEPSIKQAIRRVLAPIASGALDVNEDLLETVPPDRVNVMSVHQAKGLEFPLTIVDVGSDFAINSAAQAFKRFPTSPGESCAIEDELAPYSTRGPPSRGGMDRAFDDLYRQFFVGFSRAMDVLLLVGLDRTYDGKVRNVGVGWERGGTWPWAGLRNLTLI